MRTLRVEATATVTAGDGSRVEVAKKIWPEQDVMKLSQCRSWVTRTFNRVRPNLKSDEALRVVFKGHLTEHPFSYYSGGIRGTTRLIIREGDME